MKKLLVLSLILQCSFFIEHCTAQLSVSTVINNAHCYGQNNGSITANPIGGTTPYTYLWGPGRTTQTISGLAAATYTVKVTDHAGLTTSTTAVVSQPGVLRDSEAYATNLICHGVSTGIISIGVKGGTQPYTYTWTASVSTLSAATGLSAGTYTVALTDINGCSTTSTSLACTLTQPLAIRDSSVSSLLVNVSGCYGESNGSATIGVQYGTLPYDYVWSPHVSTSATASGLSGGSYSVTIVDSNGCSGSTTLTITQPAATFTPTLSSISYPSCNGGTGSVTVSATGSSSPYTYLWTPTSKTTATVTGLSASSYTVTVTSGSCSRSLVADITEPAVLTDTTTASLSSICSGNSDSLYTIVSGGVSPYTYSWAPTTGLSCSTCQKALATLSSSKTYTVTVTDHNGCTVTSSVNINADISCNGSSCSSAITMSSLNKVDSLPADTAKWYTFTDTAKDFLIGITDSSISIGKITTAKLYTSCGGHVLKQITVSTNPMYIVHDTNTNTPITYYLYLSDNTKECQTCTAGKTIYGVENKNDSGVNLGCIEFEEYYPNPTNPNEIESGYEGGCKCPNGLSCSGDAPALDPIICVGDSLSFNGGISYNGSAYLSIDTGFPSVNVLYSDSISGYRFNTPGTYIVIYEEDSAYGFYPLTSSFLVTVESPHTPTFSISPNPPCLGQYVMLNKTDADTGIMWRFGIAPNYLNEVNDNAPLPDTCSFFPCAFLDPDSVYLVEDYGGSLFFEEPSGADIVTGCVVKVAKNIVYDSIEPDFTYTNTSCGGGVTQFTNTTTCPDPTNLDYTWTWKFGDGDTSNGIEASHIYSSAGTYTVTLSVNNGWCASASITQTVSVSYSNPDPPIINGDAMNTNGAIDQSVYTGTYYVSGAGIYSFQNINTYNGFDGLNIEGTFVVDANCEFQGDDIYMGSNGLIDVKAPYSLTIYFSHLETCDNLWKGILVEPGASLYVQDGTLIEDADTAIECENGGHFDLVNSILNRNYVGIKVDPTSSTASDTIKSSLIACNSTPYGTPPYVSYTGEIGTGVTLNAPYSSQMSYAGIKLDSVDNIQIGLPVYGDSNLFENQYYGIRAVQSSFTAYNNVFNYIDAPITYFHASYGSSGAGIYASGDENIGTYTVNIGGPAYYQDNIFRQFRYGIFLANSINANVGNNTFYSGLYGVSMQNNTSSALDIGFNSYFNTFTGVNYAIYAYNNPASDIQIRANRISSALTGIEVVETAPNNSNSATIYGNTISAISEGIMGRFFKGWAESNNINVSNSCFICMSPLIIDGIYMEPAQNSFIFNNTITCGQTNRDDGVVMQSGFNNFVSCNSISKGVNSFCFLGDQGQDTYFDYNEMHSYNNAGIYFNATGDIGQQGTASHGTNNQWDSNACGTGVPYATYNQNNSNTTDFYVVSSGCNYLPTHDTNSGGGPNISFTGGAGTDCYVCSGTPPCNNNLHSMLVNTAKSIATTGFSTASGAYPTATLWDRKRDLYIALKSYDSTFLDSSATLRQFYDSVGTSNMGKLYDIGIQLSGNSSTGITAAQADYAGITSPDTTESTAKGVYSTFIAMLLNKTVYADSTQAAALRTIAQLCPYQYGYGVYVARALLSPVDTTIYRSTCEADTNSGGERMEAQKPKPKNILTANVYPNPANTLLHIRIYSSLADTGRGNFITNAYFYLYNNLGDLVQETKLTNNFSTISLVQLPVGIYYYRIVDEEQNPIKTDKLLIVR